MDAPVDVRGLRKAYGGRAAVDGLDLRIERGEVFGLLGPNGAGKTTTVEVLEGLRRPDAGTVRVLGEDPATAGRAWRERVGIVLQSSTGLDLLTVREVVASTARAFRRPRPVEEVIEAVGLTDEAGDRVGRLSGGQRRRVDVALGIVGRPELLFLDEPTTGFDPQARRGFWGLIRSLAHDGGTTIVLTTHYLDEAEHLSDRVGVIAAGRLVALDTPAALGGRSSALATVSWLHDGARRTERTATPTQLVATLADVFDGEVPELTVTRPTLEDTYLSLVRPHLDGETASAARALGNEVVPA
ncbi:ABC transporter ATP-binding protein [Angustibacter speluncae]